MGRAVSSVSPGRGAEPADLIAAAGEGEELGIFGDLGNRSPGARHDELDAEADHEQRSDGLHGRRAYDGCAAGWSRSGGQQRVECGIENVACGASTVGSVRVSSGSPTGAGRDRWKRSSAALVAGSWSRTARGRVSVRAVNPSVVLLSWPESRLSASRMNRSASAGPPRERRTSLRVASTSSGRRAACRNRDRDAFSRSAASTH